ncbi:MAG: hypothetical protein MUE44_11100 [Oscillatoriaceae cyanobacterium Prado104]|jgi:predicted XRE-type DNA-binding protein|nr:hypothetical protein [Oscillatoriaceae cyanobacterium Prado104]
MTQETIFEESSGNVFADLGLEDADELFTRGKIGIMEITLHLRPLHAGDRAAETAILL